MSGRATRATLRLFWIGVIAGGSSGCADPSTGWTRQGLNPDLRRADYADCRNAAHAGPASRIDQDVAASEAGRSHVVGETEAVPTVDRAEDEDNAGAVLYGCMLGKGYHPQQ
jgi:hypothetical protein